MADLNYTIDDDTVEQFRQLAALGSNKDPAHVDQVARDFMKNAGRNLPRSGRIPILGMNPEESGQPADKIIKVPNTRLSVRFFVGDSPRGLLFFDFVEQGSGLPINLPAGLTLWQRAAVQDARLMSLHQALGGQTPTGVTERFALAEGVTVVLRRGDQDVYQFRSPVIPRSTDGKLNPARHPTPVVPKAVPGVLVPWAVGYGPNML
ncbi:hypothetical protein FB451DRAFT_1466705 [Mycena latifolia]|nr:hypothetical protein FB451DRAFT_1466705 [Mycena latifolia]